MIKNNYFSIHLIIFLICVTCISCDYTWGKKHTTTYSFSQEFNDYVVFNTGSYWIYEDSASKMIDSIYLFDRIISYSDGRPGSNEKTESLNEWKHSSLTQNTLLFKGYLQMLKEDGIYAEIIAGNSNSDINYFDGNIGSYPVFSTVTIYAEKKDSISFQETFRHVKVFLNLQQMYPNHAKRVYYAKNIGLVRKELFNGQVWNLVRYHVSQ